MQYCLPKTIKLKNLFGMKLSSSLAAICLLLFSVSAAAVPITYNFDGSGIGQGVGTFTLDAAGADFTDSIFAKDVSGDGPEGIWSAVMIEVTDEGAGNFSIFFEITGSLVSIPNRFLFSATGSPTAEDIWLGFANNSPRFTVVSNDNTGGDGSVPTPSSLLLIALGLAVLGFRRRNQIKIKALALGTGNTMKPKLIDC